MQSHRITVNPVERLELEQVLSRQFVVRDEEEFITSFDPSDGDTLQDALQDLVDHFHEPDGEGYNETDMVIWQGGRIQAVIRRDRNGDPQMTLFQGRLA